MILLLVLGRVIQATQELLELNLHHQPMVSFPGTLLRSPTQLGSPMLMALQANGL